jgi:protein O-GlcNAc transferase
MKLTMLSVLAVVVTVGCAQSRARPAATVPLSPDGPVAASAETQAAGAPTSAYIHAARELSRRARPEPTDAQSVERWSPGLASAMANLSAAPTVEHEIALAQVFFGLGIADQAYDHFARAAKRDPQEGAAWDGLARIWRDWGFPHLGLGDAYRAVYTAPDSPAVHNTLGTILQQLGEGRGAREHFTRALALDAGAAYAQNNICYSWLMEADSAAAADACGRALAIDPGMRPARNNLALARAIGGDLAGAAEIFGAVGDEAAAQYNLGIVYLGQRRYSAAAEAFDKAATLRPALALAQARAHQARQHAANDLEKGGGRERR